ncbi:MAG: hypothetical protein ACREEE_05590 [Dongiaceae bacterium]
MEIILGNMVYDGRRPKPSRLGLTTGREYRKRQKLAARQLKVADLRRRGLSYREIGAAIGVCRERVRKILAKAGEPELIGRDAAPMVARRLRKKVDHGDMACEWCSKVFAKRTPRRWFCSKTCSDLARQDNDSPALALALRRRGMTWREAARRVPGWENRPHPAQLARHMVTKYLHRTGADGDGLFGFRGRRAAP